MEPPANRKTLATLAVASLLGGIGLAAGGTAGGLVGTDLAGGRGGRRAGVPPLWWTPDG
jgi:hypothetical protein